MQSFTAHKYWTEVLGFTSDQNNNFISRATVADSNKKFEFLKLVCQGFYPISYTSPLGFKRFYDLTENDEAKAVAKIIYEVEMGMHPFIKGGKNQDVLHCNQFVNTISSLEDNLKIELSDPVNFSLNKRLSIENGQIALALAVCNEIEHAAPAIIHYIQDFVAQWQYLNKRPSYKIDRLYLDEHNITEGSECEEQHIGMVEKMIAPHLDVVQSKEYEDAVDFYHQQCVLHLDEIYSKINICLS